MSEENVYKVVLNKGPVTKTVLLREMKVKYENEALSAVGNRGGKNQNLGQKLMADELLKILIVEVDGKRPTALELEQIDKMFTYAEVGALRKVMSKLLGADEEGELETPSFEIMRQSSGKQ